MEQLEFFGNENQRNLQKKYYRLWPYLKADTRLSFVGRAIGIDDPKLEEVEKIIGLTKELGFLSLAFTRPSILDGLCSAFEAKGLKVGIWQHWVSNEKTKPSCHSIEASLQIPPNYTIERVSPEIQPLQMQKLQELMQNCGVAPLPGYILRGQEIPTIAEMIITPQDEIVATGASIFRHNPDGVYGKAAHVGFLATENGHRGKGLARLLLARVILASYEKFSAELVHTGVRPDNIPSQRVCQSCGLEDSGMYCLGVIYPQIMEQDRFTS